MSHEGCGGSHPDRVVVTARILVFNDNYPTAGPGYADSFVRTRLEAYRQALGAEICVIKLGRNRAQELDYELNGISVRHLGRACLPDFFREFRPDVILVHFIQAYLCRRLPVLAQTPIIVWIHGEEALSWRSRLFYFRTLRPMALARYMVRNVIQMRAMRGLVGCSNASNGRVRFVFVSRWMMEAAARDVGARPHHFSIIPNFIDTDFFAAETKSADLRRKVLLIRSFNTAKYANDIAVAAIQQLRRQYGRFDELYFTVVGFGSLWKELTKRISYPNVALINRVLDHDGIRALHRVHGVFLCPTRQDAQGVSMCEAMSSGLVPIASDNTAIPEFLTESQGYLCRSASEFADAIIRVAESPDDFISKSSRAAAYVREKAGYQATIAREIELIRNVCGIPAP